MGISRRQDRAERNAGNGVDPRTARGVGHHGSAGVLGAVHLCLAQLRAIPSSDAALSMPALGGNAPRPRAFGDQMGEAARVDGQPGRVSHARSGFAAAADAARSAVMEFAAKACGATAIEYALIAALISLAIITALGSLGTQMAAMYVLIVNAMPG